MVGYQEAWRALGQSLAAEGGAERTVCMGADWYTFPSHFFVPSHVRLRYVDDDFHGQLPQPYACAAHSSCAWSAASTPPPQPFNDVNGEETSRYVSLADCDYVVTAVPGGLQTPHSKLLRAMNQSASTVFTEHLSRAVLDPSRSPAWTRAFFLPGISAKHNAIMRVTAYRKIANNDNDI